MSDEHDDAVDDIDLGDPSEPASESVDESDPVADADEASTGDSDQLDEPEPESEAQASDVDPADEPEVEPARGGDESEEVSTDSPPEDEASDDVSEPVEESAPEPELESEPEPEPESEVEEISASSAIHSDEPSSDIEADEPKKWGRWILLGAAVLLGALYVGGYFMTGTRMPANATIGGVDVSGKSPAEARALVGQALLPNVDKKVILKHQKLEFRVKPKNAGLTFDVDRSVSNAGGERSWNPSDMVGLFFGTHTFAPAVEADDAKLQSVIGTISEAVNREVVEAQITFPKAKPKARQPRPGLVVARDDAADTIKAAYLVADQPVEVPTVVVEPAVDSDGLDEALVSIAKPAVSGPITLKVGDQKVSLPVTAYVPALVVRVEEGQLRPYLNPKKLAKPLTSSTTGIGKKAVDASVEIKDGKAVVIPGKKGVGLQPEEMSVKLLPALTETGADRAVEVTASVVEPEFTTKDAKKLKIKEKTGEFSTFFPYAEYRNINQSRAAALIDGTIVMPGETFSFNDTVGERTVANGFTVGTVINGGVFREELGGGVSQTVTTLYNASFFAGMDDVEHHPHAFYIDRYPVGREATVYFGNLDLRFKNPTEYGVLIRAYVNKSAPGRNGEMHVELWSTKVWDITAGQSARRNFRNPGEQYDDTDRCVPQGPIQGFDIDIYRTFSQGGKQVKSETKTARYQAADRVICGKKPKGDD